MNHKHSFKQPTISVKTNGSIGHVGTDGNRTDANMMPYINVYRWHRIA